MEDVKNKISIKNEMLRKLIHLASSIVPVLYYFVERDAAIIILGSATVLLMLMDIVRIKNESFRDFYLKCMKPILRGHEIENRKAVFTGATYITLAFLICVVVFPKPLAITSMFVVIFCDSLAAIIGKSYGKHFISNKTIEGSMAFFVTGIIIILLTPKITNFITEYYLGFITVFFTTIFELIPLKIDDNISTPIFFGFVYLILLKIFL